MTSPCIHFHREPESQCVHFHREPESIFTANLSPSVSCTGWFVMEWPILIYFTLLLSRSFGMKWKKRLTIAFSGKLGCGMWFPRLLLVLYDVWFCYVWSIDILWFSSLLYTFLTFLVTFFWLTAWGGHDITLKLLMYWRVCLSMVSCS